MVFDAAIVGAGPAGCSCALWVAEYGLRPLLIDRRDAACSTLQGLDFAQEWVLGSQRRTLAQIGADYRAHLAARLDIDQRFDTTPRSLSRLPDGLWHMTFVDGSAIDARTVVIATGLSPLRPRAYFNAELMSDTLFDAVSLTHRRASLTERRILLLGGGDNTAENALTLAAQGNTVTVSSRHALHAQQRFIDRLTTCAAVTVRVNEPAPTLRRTRGGYLASWADGAEAHFDTVAVLFGYRPRRDLLDLLPHGTGPSEGVFLAGDVSERLHPCVPCAVGDGAHTGWQVERWLARPVGHLARTRPAPMRRLMLERLRLPARVGILDHELLGPQPLLVWITVELPQASAASDDIGHVLDYRHLRTVAIEEVERGHINLLETLAGRIVQRLLADPRIARAVVRIDKPGIFDDCDAVGVEVEGVNGN